MLLPNPELEVLLPVYNEAESIEATLAEVYAELSPRVHMQFIISEDGSSDGTREILHGLSARFPMKLITGPERKGYARALLDGMAALEAPYLLTLDSDGQIDPRDFWKLWHLRSDDLVVAGWRINRADPVVRKLMSRSLYRVYRMMFGVPLHDPSCSFMLAPKMVVHKLQPELGMMNEGFWWEFMARIHRGGVALREVAVMHRPRAAGATRVYKAARVPGIVMRNLYGLGRIWMQTRPQNALNTLPRRNTS